MIKYNRCNIIIKLWGKYSLFIKFCLVGASNVVLSYTVYFFTKIGIILFISEYDCLYYRNIKWIHM